MPLGASSPKALSPRPLDQPVHQLALFFERAQAGPERRFERVLLLRDERRAAERMTDPAPNVKDYLHFEFEQGASAFGAGESGNHSPLALEKCLYAAGQHEGGCISAAFRIPIGPGLGIR